MSQDILHQIRRDSGNPNFEMCPEIHNKALLSIEDMCYIMSGTLSIKLGMPAPDRLINDAFNTELQRERQYDRDTLNNLVQTNVPLLNTQQK